MPDKEQIDELLRRMSAENTLTEQEKGLVNIFATAQEIDAAKASAELNTTTKIGTRCCKIPAKSYGWQSNAC